MARFDIDTGLATEVVARLGCALPSDRADVDELYTRWVDQVWFDPIAKTAAIRSGLRPPGADIDEWCRQWCSTGLGGTCWGQSTAFAAIISLAGIDTWIGLERMVDIDGIDFHCHVVADVDGTAMVYDLVHATTGGLALQDGSVSTRGPLRVGFTRVDGRFEHTVTAGKAPFRYRLLSTRLDLDDVAAFCDVSATHTGVASGRFFARRLPGDSMVKVRPSTDGHALEVTTCSGTAGKATTSTFDDIGTGLTLLGWNDAAIHAVEAAGLLRRIDGSLRFV